MRVKATRQAICVACLRGVGIEQTHQPVVVLSPLAREGRGLRALCTPGVDTGITKSVWHAEATSLRGRVFRYGVDEFADGKMWGTDWP
jgi:hypothetical protein